jgi:hypothetical protein
LIQQRILYELLAASRLRHGPQHRPQDGFLNHKCGSDTSYECRADQHHIHFPKSLFGAISFRRILFDKMIGTAALNFAATGLVIHRITATTDQRQSCLSLMGRGARRGSCVAKKFARVMLGG